MTAEPTSPYRVYQTRQQVIVGWLGSLIAASAAIVVLLLPTHDRHGGYLIAAIACLAALGAARFAMCGVRTSPAGVRVRNLFTTTDLTWDQIREFKLSPVGACLIGLDNRTWISIVGVEQTNFAWLTNRGDTRENHMIDELNKLLREHRSPRPTTGPVPGR
jgi:hypothetical protein